MLTVEPANTFAATAVLYPIRNGTRRAADENHISHPEELVCTYCGQAYSLEYEHAFLHREPAIIEDLLLKFAEKVNHSHAEGHQQPYLVVATTVRQSSPGSTASMSA
jgi:hypothetical protein